MRHLDPALLQAALAGDIPIKTLLRLLLAHMAELCPECGESVRWLQQAAAGGEEPAPAPRRAEDAAAAFSRVEPRFVGAFDRQESQAARWASEVRRERKKAREDVRELLRLPRPQRRRKIERAQTRFRSRAVADLLYEESRRLIRDRPDEARDLAELIGVVLLWMRPGPEAEWARDLGILAHAWVANTYRVECDYPAAERVFGQVRARMEVELVGEGVHAEVASLEASLRVDQGRCEEARGLLDRAEALYRLAGDRERVAKTLVQRALLEDRQSDSLAAAELQRQALELMEWDIASMAGQGSIVNLALFLTNGGRPAEAAELLLRYRDELTTAGMWERPELVVIRGRLAAAEGRVAEAEELFLAARADLIRKSDAVRAAVASMDLALLYLAQGKTVELRRIARLMGAIFESVELDGEVLATVMLFQKALEQDALTEAAIRGWRRRLEVGGTGRGRKVPS